MSDSYDSGLDIDPERKIPKLPKLERSICLNDNRSLTNFLNLSRLNVDDSIRTRLNSVINHHESRQKKSILLFASPDKAQSPCLPLIQQFIFPQWYKRLEAINFCNGEVAKMAQDVKNDPQNNMSDEERNKLLRVDPYAMRDIERKRIERSEEVAALQTKWENEKEVEGIVRERSQAVIYDLCDMGGFDVKKEFLQYVKQVIK